MSRANKGIVIAAVVFFGGSMLGTVMTRSAQPETPSPESLPPVVRQLELDTEQAELIASHDPNFCSEMKVLRSKLDEARAALAAAFEDGSSDDVVRNRSEAVLEAHIAVERRVMEYLITVRDHLTPEQQKKLSGLCAEKVRERGKRWGRGWGDGGGHGNGSDEGGNRGKGRGRGGAFRGGRGG